MTGNDWPDKEGLITQADYADLAAFRRALNQFLHFSEAAARNAGLTPPQHQALLAIMGAPNPEQVTVGRVAENLQIQHHSAVGLVNRLAAQGLVQRRQADQDRRHVFVSLTPKGLEVLERLTAAHRAELRRLGPQIRLILTALTEEEEQSRNRASRLS